MMLLAALAWGCDASVPGALDGGGVGELDQGSGGSGGSGGTTGTMDMASEADAAGDMGASDQMVEPDGPESDGPASDGPAGDGPEGDGPERDAAASVDQGPDLGEPEQRNGGVGDPCPRGFEQDCDEVETDRCSFIGENDIVPGVTAVCSRGCDDANPCGGGLCCYPDGEGDVCLPAGFCALLRGVGDACEDDAECPQDAPLCATEGGSGARFCTLGCAAGGACPDGFCCDANVGGRPNGSICKPDDLCPEPCAVDEDCPAVQHCVEGACVPRVFACEQDIDCPLGERCEEGDCVPLEVVRLGQDCSGEDVACDEGAPVCVELPDDHGERCAYGCAFHRDCPASFCCVDLAGLGRADGLFCTDVSELCPPNLPCGADDDCSADQYCHFGQCQERGPQDVARGGACDQPGVCEDGLDCVFRFVGGRFGRGDRDSFEGALPGLCSSGCSGGADCADDECCRLAVFWRSRFTRGWARATACRASSVAGAAMVERASPRAVQGTRPTATRGCSIGAWPTASSSGCARGSATRTVRAPGTWCASRGRGSANRSRVARRTRVVDRPTAARTAPAGKVSGSATGAPTVRTR